ncbi:stromal cell-derived factor 2 isoform X1 [Harmonia axyridis]|uniref:stromal cell-derived factor 2 isoform X1 n=1 Tax=Harmonia axyridis TaxID=115357 RepID=UPI001E277FA6|nr:stromal cell-derived factor 2 isoform X1 [Harmonia axyridis]
MNFPFDIYLTTFLLISLNLVIVFGAKERYVTCGSVIKLLNTDHRVRLHSHDVKYGTGSGQQSVTGIEIKEDVGSHWVVKAANGKICPRGQPIKCGSLIRLEHLESKRNLHSHIFSSPLSSQQEISCYGENGEGDTGDHWKVICSGYEAESLFEKVSNFAQGVLGTPKEQKVREGENWLRDDPVMLKHDDTSAYLATSGRTFGRPINGQVEVVGMSSSTGPVHWQAMEGVFLHNPDISASHHVHTEL